MASGKRPPSDNPGARRKRPPTVINLEATEVSPEAAAKEQPEQQADPAQAAVPSPSDPLPVAEAPEPVPVTNEPPKDAATAGAAFEPPPPRDPPPRQGPEPEPQPERRRSPGWIPEELTWAQAGAGIAGAAGALVVVLLLWLAGAVSGGGRTPPETQTADLSSRLASIEKKLKGLADRPSPPSADPNALDALASRLSKLESVQAMPRPPVTDPVVLGRLSATENALKSVSDNAAALSRRADAVDAALRDTDSKIGKLTAALADVQSTVRSAAAGSDRASRLALAAAALRDAVDQGQPFAAELAVVKPLASEASVVAALEPFAASGVPNDAALAKELAAIVQPMLRASEQKRAAGGFIDRLQASAEKLVRIQRIDEPEGDGRDTALARIGRYASQGNATAAANEITKLPADARAPMQAWLARVQARNKAVEASRRLAADAVAALKATP